MLVLTGWSGLACAAEESINPITLFNGPNLNGFYSWLVDTHRDDPRRVFTVTNGMIRISGDGLGYLATKEPFKDYRLVAEFKWGTTNSHWGDRIGRARDSGIFLHATGPDGNSHDGKGAFKAAIECQIMEGAVGDILLIRGNDDAGKLIAPRITAEVADKHDAEGWFYWSGGSKRRRTIETWGRLNWSGKDPKWKDETGFGSTHGEWTRIECVCEGTRIAIYVNGKLVNEALDVYPSSGQILLQCEGSEIFFRKLELHPLRKSAREK